MAVLWTDGTWTAAYAISAPEFSSPIPGVSTAYVLTQDFMQLLANFTPLALNTAHPDYATFYLVSESPRIPMGGGVVKWTRTYAAVPATHDEFEKHAYNFIGAVGVFGFNVATVAGRERKVLSVNSRVSRDYFLIGAGQTYTTAGEIPVTRATQYCQGSIYIPADYTFDTTIPTTAEYQAAVAEACDDGWAASVTTQTIDATGAVTAHAFHGQLVAEDSGLARWMGNIWVRETRYVLAQ